MHNPFTIKKQYSNYTFPEMTLFSNHEEVIFSRDVQCQ